jgi:hypothetical protein
MWTQGDLEECVQKRLKEDSSTSRAQSFGGFFQSLLESPRYSNNICGHFQKRRTLRAAAAGFTRPEVRRIFSELAGVTEAGVLTYVVICEGDVSSCEGTEYHTVRKNGRKSYDSASCVDLRAQTYLAFAEKRYQGIIPYFFWQQGLS